MFKLICDKNDFRLLNGLVILLFAIAPFYFQPNYGGAGLELTFNISTWATASIIICFTGLLVTVRKSIKLPHRFLYFIAVPVIIILNSLISGTSQPVSFFFRELFIVGGVFFFFSLFQYKLRQNQLEWILLTLALSTIPHSIIGVLQTYKIEIFGAWSATGADGEPRGIFQQVNVQASFMATGVAISMYLISRPIAKSFDPVLSSLLILSLGLNSYVIVYSGSRVGLLSLILSLSLLILFRHQQLSKNRLMMLFAFLAITSGAFFGKAGLAHSIDKSMDITQGITADARINMYAIALELVSQKPVQGHGIGNFLRTWNLQTGDYYSRHPNAALPGYIEHPHNELVFWMIEGGLVIVSGILAAIVVVVLGLIRCRCRRAAGYITMLLPITLHAQLELPFYISSVHWFLWLFLIFVVMRHSVFKKNIAVSISALRLIQCTNLVVLVGSLYFLQHTSRAQTDIMNYIDKVESKPPYLEIALKNHYFKHQAQELAIRTNLYNGISTNNLVLVGQSINWFEESIAIRPKIQLFEDLINAYDYLDDNESLCKTIKTGNRMYPKNVPLRELTQTCID